MLIHKNLTIGDICKNIQTNQKFADGHIIVCKSSENDLGFSVYRVNKNDCSIVAKFGILKDAVSYAKTIDLYNFWYPVGCSDFRPENGKPCLLKWNINSENFDPLINKEIEVGTPVSSDGFWIYGVIGWMPLSELGLLHKNQAKQLLSDFYNNKSDNCNIECLEQEEQIRDFVKFVTENY